MTDPRDADPDDHDPSDRPLADLGRLIREERARGEAEPPRYRPLSDERRAAIIAKALDEPQAVLVPASPERAANDRGWLRHLVGYCATAAAAAALVWTVTRTDRPADPSDPSDPADPTTTPIAKEPAFGSWDLRGGGPSAEHLGAPSAASVVCLGRPLSLSLAVEPDATIDREAPLQLLLVVRPTEGRAYPLLYDVTTDQRFSWSDDGRALIFEDALEGLAPLTPGAWVLEPSIGAPGACSREGGPGCKRLPARAFEVVEGERCDEPK